ncbi:tetratricopeptide repeat protein [Aquimarina sp. 2304DJ70-9]|uniref:tetratricopeptide repeat protein n=1 Tax=Aquimarina penaris TaxID=3231044 RepID=UPI003462EF8E
MRKNCILLFLLLSTMVYGQEDIQEVLKQDICECFGEKTKRSLSSNNAYVFKLCLLTKIKDYSEEFQTILKEERFIEISEHKGQNYDINLKNLGLFIAGHLEYFIQDCDIYYLYSSASRIQELTIRAGTYRFEKAMLSRKLKKPEKDPKLFYERGMTYLAIGEYEKAKQDFYKCLNIDPGNEKAIYSLGWACELNEEFGVAIGWYKELTKKGNRYDAAKALEITKRKVKDKEAFESLKTLNQLIAIKSASISKEKKSIPEGNSVPVMQGCEELTDQNEIKKCMSELVKNM